MKNHYYALILAGGGGTRLWPMSRSANPKQMQRISGNRTMFQMTVDRLDGVIPIENVFVLTTEAQSVELKKQFPQIPDENFILETKPRGTASVIGLGAIHLFERDPQATLVVLPSDHFIKNTALFHDILNDAYDAAADDHLVTIGIEPTAPATGYGYIEEGAQLPGTPAKRVLRFREKPDFETAKAFLASGNFWWNGGMFIWRAERILEEIRRFLPDVSDRLGRIRAAIGTDGYDAVFRENWEVIQPTTIDYGVLEKADDIVFLPAKGLEWDDIGSWDSLFDVLDADESGNYRVGGRQLAIDSCGNLTGSDQADKLIVTIGLQDTVVIESGNAILVCPRSESQRVREAVERLKADGETRYL